MIKTIYRWLRPKKPEVWWAPNGVNRAQYYDAAINDIVIQFLKVNHVDCFVPHHKGLPMVSARPIRQTTQNSEVHTPANHSGQIKHEVE